ncbi:hypothetical protein VTH06DRAFT_3240 [Thermothelomyces fergusii]
MSQNNNKIEEFDDPTLGVAPEHDDFLGQLNNEAQAGNFGDASQGAGNEDLFADASVNIPAAQLGALEPQSVFDFPQIEPLINPAVSAAASTTAAASQPLQVQLTSPFPVLPRIPADQAHNDLVPGGGLINQGHSQPPGQNLAGSNQAQASFPINRPLGQGGNGANQAATGQGTSGFQFQYNPAYGNPTYPAPPAPHILGQSGGFANMYAQPAQPLLPGYPFHPPQVVPNALDVRNQGYPAAFMAPLLGLGGPAPQNTQLHMLNQPANPPPPNQSVAPGQGHPLNGMKMNHKRNRRGSPSNDPSQFYAAPVGLLRPWGPKVVVGKNRQEDHIFRYYQQTAELRPSLTYTKEQLVAFFLGHGHPYPRRSLTLWIQNTPAQINERYANRSESSKCRYKDCPAKQNTILKGFFRVAFDEFSDESGTIRDPFRNAGYMHLHCFESLFDLGYLIHYGAARHNFRILPDRRDFVHESRNPASINRDHAEMIEAYEAWVDGQKARADRIEQDNVTRPRGQEYTGFHPLPQMILPHAQRLGCTLTDKHLSLQVKGRAAMRESRGGIHIGIHRGDLDLFVHLHNQKSQGVPLERALPALPAQERQGAEAATQTLDKGKKRAHKEDDDDENSDESGSRSPKRPKRQHIPNDPGPSGTQPDARPRAARRKRSSGEPDVSLASSTPKRPKQSHSPNPSSKGKGVVRLTPLRLSPPPPQKSSAIFPSSAYSLQTRDLSNTPNGRGPLSRNPWRPQLPLSAFPNAAAYGGACGAGSDIVEQSAAQGNLICVPSQTIQSRLSCRRAPAQAHALGAVPGKYAAMVLPPNGTLRDDRLAERIGRLSQRQRREVEQVVWRLERKGSSDKKCQSL